MDGGVFSCTVPTRQAVLSTNGPNMGAPRQLIIRCYGELEFILARTWRLGLTAPSHHRTAWRRLSPATLHSITLILWAILICCVIVGELLPAASPVMVAIGRLHIWDKLQHFGAYLALSMLPVIGFRDRRHGIVAGISMFLLGVLLEGGQHFSPGRAVELGDVIANGAGVSCGTLLGLPIRTLATVL